MKVRAQIRPYSLNGCEMMYLVSSPNAGGLFLLTFVEKTVDGCLCGDNGGALDMQGGIAPTMM